MRIILFLSSICLCSLSCQKDNSAKSTKGNSVEIYLLKTYETVPGKCEVDASKSVLQNDPVVENDDIIEYSKLNYQFRLSSDAAQNVKALQDHTPFAVTVDKQVIYFGIIKRNTSNSSCDNSITMDNDWTTNDKIFLRLGYPGFLQGVAIDDRRNNPKLIATLKKQGKLN